ncbi:MAG: ABC transporter ATP-binding protein/permease [Firmicutes bacterium]|nr:ABC transporter ATP-binding protein/permease [Bacillota bacterium]
MLRKFISCIKGYEKPTILTPTFMLAEVSMECIMPLIIADLISEIEAGCGMDVIIQKGLLLVLMAMISLAGGAGAGYFAARASAGFAKNLRHAEFESIERFSFENIDKYSSSSLVTRMTTDVSNVQMAFMMLIRTAFRSPLMFIFSIIMAYRMGGALAGTYAVLIPILGFGLYFISKKAMPAFRSVFRKYDKLNESIEENVMAMRAVKGFVREDYEKKKFGDAAENIRRDFTHAERIVALNSPLMQLCMYANTAIIAYIGSRTIVTSMGIDLGVGQLSGLLTYGVQILMSLNMLSMIYVMLTMAAESAKRISEVLVEEPTIKNPENPVTEIKNGDIDFENVSFKYSARAERYALEGINLHIKSGETVGILGGTGSSKTTLIQPISRLYDVTEGVVKVGGVDVRDYDIEALRNSVAVVLQKNLLFSGTIADNLRWGNENATDEELREACALSQAEEFINSFPEGYDTMIEQGGTNVSGGQKQRLCIARALLKKPKILILDDSTSAVDTKTDALIRRGFDKFIPETTKIIIAQRVASVENADKIIIMDNGKIADVGTHEELLSRSDIYREIYEQQVKGGGEDEN